MFTPPDTMLLAGVPNDAITLYHRNLVGIKFDDTTSGRTIRTVLARYQATIRGGSQWTGEFYVEIPDPGPTIAAVDSIVARIGAEPGVRSAAHMSYRLPMKLRGVTPNDGLYARDTARPALPDSVAWPVSPLLATAPWDTSRTYFRNVFGVLFDMVASGASVRAVLRKYQATVIGGIGEMYVVELPDPGPGYAAVDSLRRLIRAEHGVVAVDPLAYLAPMRIKSRRLPAQ